MMDKKFPKYVEFSGFCIIVTVIHVCWLKVWLLKCNAWDGKCDIRHQPFQNWSWQRRHGLATQTRLFLSRHKHAGGKWLPSDAPLFDYILITNLMHHLLFILKIIFSSTCFEPQVLIFRRIQLYTCSIWYCHSL